MTEKVARDCHSLDWQPSTTQQFDIEANVTMFLPNFVSNQSFFRPLNSWLIMLTIMLIILYMGVDPKVCVRGFV